jgi:hypothetical protein
MLELSESIFSAVIVSGVAVCLFVIAGLLIKLMGKLMFDDDEDKKE